MVSKVPVENIEIGVEFTECTLKWRWRNMLAIPVLGVEERTGRFLALTDQPVWMNW